VCARPAALGRPTRADPAELRDEIEAFEIEMRSYQRSLGPCVDYSQRAFDDLVASTREGLGTIFGDLRGIPRRVLHPFTPTMAQA
jgi:hypothetical protein